MNVSNDVLVNTIIIREHVQLTNGIVIIANVSEIGPLVFVRDMRGRFVHTKNGLLVCS